MDVLIGHITPQQVIFGKIDKFGSIMGEIKSDSSVIGILETIEIPPEYEINRKR